MSQAQRTTILELHSQGVSKREIAQVLGVSRVAVRKVLRANCATLPELQRAEKAEPYRSQILELFAQCKGNLVRVHEELVAAGAELSYPALTAFCRRHGIGQSPVMPAGQYEFAPGEEMQHDTSPHEIELACRKRKVQTGHLRIHATTKRQVAAMFGEEKPSLLPLPLEPFRLYQFGDRRVNLDGCVEVDAAYYSAPPGWIGRSVKVQWDGHVVRVLDPRTGQLLREHRSQERGRHRIPDEDKPAQTPRSTV